MATSIFLCLLSLPAMPCISWDAAEEPAPLLLPLLLLGMANTGVAWAGL